MKDKYLPNQELLPRDKYQLPRQPGKASGLPAQVAKKVRAL